MIIIMIVHNDAGDNDNDDNDDNHDEDVCGHGGDNDKRKIPQ